MATTAEYQAFAAQMAQAYGIPTDLYLWQIGSESSWNPNAKNPNSSARGIAQFTAPTAQWRGVNQDDPYDSLRGGAEYMRYLYDKTGSWEKALDSYGTTHNNPTKKIQAAQILAAQVDAMNKSGGALIGYVQGDDTGNNPSVSVYVPQNPGDSGAGGTDTVNSGDGGNGGAFGSASLPDWIAKYLGGAALFILGLLLIALAVWATVNDNK